MAEIYRSAEGARAVRERYGELLERWPVPSRRLHVPTREGETFVVTCGPEDAPALLLLHGSAANSAMWMRDAAAWSTHFRVVAVDVIGEPGLSAPVRPPLGSEAHVCWLDDVMSGLGLARASFVGVSLGGWLALDYALRRPTRVERLVLLCPGGIGRQKIPLRVLALAALGRWGARKAREVVLGRLADGPAVPPSFVAFMSLVASRRACRDTPRHAHFRPRREKLPIFDDAALHWGVSPSPCWRSWEGRTCFSTPPRPKTGSSDACPALRWCTFPTPAT